MMEREYKFTPNTFAGQETFDEAAFWAYLGATPAEKHLHSVYFDTESSTLSQAGAALRLRKSGSERVITFKMGKNSGENGFFARREWEIPAETIEEGILLLQTAVTLPKGRALLVKAVAEGIHIRTETSFVRRFADISRKGATFEAAADTGTLGFARLPFTEIELELKSGEEAAFAAMANKLAARFGLVPGRQSKLAQALLGDERNGGIFQ